MNIELVKFAAISFLLFTTPGFAFLFVTRLWKDWPALQRWIVAIGISIAFYPVLFYWTRTLLPAMHLGAHKLWTLIIIFSIFTILYFWKERKTLFHLEPLEWVAVGVISLTLLTRFWIIADHPYPAWSDALHHVLITQLTADNGQLPVTLDPYDSASLDMYHLGFYSITGSVKLLTGLPAHTVFLWVSQLLNGLCGIGIYLFLDRKIGRKGALIGLVAIGLWSYQPAWYVNWSRSTSLAANTILFITLLVNWETLVSFIKKEKQNLLSRAGLIGISGLMNAGIFLLHFRVAGYYLPLLLIICLISIWKNAKEHRVVFGLVGIILIGITSLLFVFPALLKAMLAYLAVTSVSYITETGFESNLFPLTAIYLIGAQKWVFILTGVVTGIGLLLRNKTIPILLAWLVLLGMELYAYLTGISVLMFTNVMGIAAIIYIPLAILLGLGFGEIFLTLENKGYSKLSNGLLVVVMIGSIGFVPQRIKGIEDYRYLFTADDLPGMAWISSNVPKDAVIAINTDFWLENNVIGTDGGYWIPYFTGRKTTAGNMLSTFGSDYNQIISRSRAVVALYSENPSVESLCEMGVDYLYNGAKSPYTGKRFDLSKMLDLDQVQLLFQSGDVSVLKICDR